MSDEFSRPPFETSTGGDGPRHQRDEAERARLSRRYATLVVAAVSLIVLSCLAFIVPVPYVTMRPGPVFDTLGDFEGEPMLAVDESVETFPTAGTLDFTTVSVTSAAASLTFMDAARAFFDSDVAVVPRSLVYPDGQSADESQQQSAAQLISSKDSSRVAALRAAGYDVPETPVIAMVVEGGAAETVLLEGDEVLEVDGEAVGEPVDVVEAVGAVEPGDDVTLTIQREGETSEVAITTRPDEEDPTIPRIGVSIGSTFQFPIDIVNNVGDSIGGPSAGMMFALAIYDILTPGELTGGLRVAGTGEIAPDGTVGPIGGVRQKMAGAADSGVEVFLVPAANCAEALNGDDFDLTLVEVRVLDGAIEALEALADDPEATVPLCN